MLESAGVIAVAPQGMTTYIYSDKAIEGAPVINLTPSKMAKTTSSITVQQARADSRRAALAERVGQVAVSDTMMQQQPSQPSTGGSTTSGTYVHYTVSLGSSSQTSNISATTAQLGAADSWAIEMPSGDTWNHVISNYTGPSTATSGTSRLVVQTGDNFGPIVSGYSTTPTGTYSWNFSNATTGALYTIHFTVS